TGLRCLIRAWFSRPRSRVPSSGCSRACIPRCAPAPWNPPMRCAADRQRPHRRARRTAVLRCAALIVLVCLAAGCTGGGAGHKRTARGPAARRDFFGQGAVFITGSGIIALSGGKHGGRPQISVPPIPPASSSRPITMPLDVYEEVASEEQDALGEAQTL